MSVENLVLSQEERSSVVENLEAQGWIYFTSPRLKNLSSQLLVQANEKSELFKKAHVGKGSGKQNIQEVRGDSILWHDPKPQSDLEKLLSELRLEFREKLFLPVKSYECHFARYEKGSFYLRHSDRHKKSSHRLITFVFYLTSLTKQEGGEICLYPELYEVITLSPQQGYLLIFDSEIEHEVKPTQVVRFSMTGWFRDDEEGGSPRIE